MLYTLSVICYIILLIIIAVLCVMLAAKYIRFFKERRYFSIKSAVESPVNDFILGVIDAQQLKQYAKKNLHENIIVDLLCERLTLLTGKEKKDIIEFIQTTVLFKKQQALLRSSNKWKKAQAACLLGRSKSALIIPYCLPLLKDKHDEVIITAANALTSTGETAVIPHLIDTLDTIKPIKAHSIVDCIIELCSLNPSEGIPLITSLLRSSKDHLRAWGCVMLGEIRSFDEIKTMHAMVKDLSPAVRSAAVEALGKIGDPASYEYISLALLDPDWNVRYKAAWGLGELKYANAVPALSRAIMDRQWEVNYQAVKSLIAADPSFNGFINLLNSDFPFVRWRAAESLELTGFIDNEIEKLGESLPDEERKKKMAALTACALNGAAIPFTNNKNSSNQRIKQSMREILDKVQKHAS